MKRTKLHALNRESARKRIKAAKSNEPFMAALMERDHRGHKDAVDQWTRLHQVAFADTTASPGSQRNAANGRAESGVRQRGATERNGRRAISKGAEVIQPNAGRSMAVSPHPKSKRFDRREPQTSVLLPDPENPVLINSPTISRLLRQAGESESDWVRRLEFETDRVANSADSFEDLVIIREAILREIGFYDLEPGHMDSDGLIERDGWRVLATLQNIPEDGWQDAISLGPREREEFDRTGLLPIVGVIGPDGNIYHRLSFRQAHPVGGLLQAVDELVILRRPPELDIELAVILAGVVMRPTGRLGGIAPRSIASEVVAPRVSSFIRSQGRSAATLTAMGASLALSGSTRREGASESEMEPAPDLPPLPGTEPPERPENEESFEEASIEVEVVPGFDVPEPDGPKVLIFPDVSEEIYRTLIIERRERQETRDQLDAIRDFYTDHNSHWEHFLGGRDKDGRQLREFRVDGPGVAFPHPVTGKPGDSRPGSIYVDLTFRLPDGSFVHIQTVDVDRDGQPTERELRTAKRVADLTGDPVYLFPKIWQLEEIERRNSDFLPIEVR